MLQHLVIAGELDPCQDVSSQEHYSGEGAEQQDSNLRSLAAIALVFHRTCSTQIVLGDQ